MLCNFDHSVIISIHALREEGDSSSNGVMYFTSFISIHALREEGDFLQVLNQVIAVQFLSTPSARRATGTIRVV